ncbi:hypothetical protein ACIQUF_24870 [Pseudomonas sp. NPDC090233]|uniref:hypothetical protein n=1 Tax=Pseudomonas sp. NPDC090233 TaxID=3364479 RepID=UPI00383BC576
MTDINIATLEEQLRSDDKEMIISALLYGCYNVQSPRWIQEQCVALIDNDKNLDIQGLAVTCLGHVARMHKAVDWQLIMLYLQCAFQNPELTGRAQDALGDIETFVGLKVKLLGAK